MLNRLLDASERSCDRRWAIGLRGNTRSLLTTAPGSASINSASSRLTISAPPLIAKKRQHAVAGQTGDVDCRI